jgi:hypothetical protein
MHMKSDEAGKVLSATRRPLSALLLAPLLYVAPLPRHSIPGLVLLIVDFIRNPFSHFLICAIVSHWYINIGGIARRRTSTSVPAHCLRYIVPICKTVLWRRLRLVHFLHTWSWDGLPDLSKKKTAIIHHNCIKSSMLLWQNDNN